MSYITKIMFVKADTADEALTTVEAELEETKLNINNWISFEAVAHKNNEMFFVAADGVDKIKIEQVYDIIREHQQRLLRTYKMYKNDSVESILKKDYRILIDILQYYYNADEIRQGLNIVWAATDWNTEFSAEILHEDWNFAVVYMYHY